MKCKLQKLDIPDKNPFLNCQLGREKYADILKAIVLTYNEALCISYKWKVGNWEDYVC